MPANFSHLSPVRQFDDYSCWAASLKFWYKAAHNKYKSQTGLLDKFNHLSDDDGSMGELGLIHIMGACNMYPSLADPASQFSGEEVRNILANYGPILVAYKSSSSRFKHVVVLHGIDEAGAMPYVHVMDPGAHFDQGTQKYVGRHVYKKLSEYNWFDKVIYGRKR